MQFKQNTRVEAHAIVGVARSRLVPILVMCAANHAPWHFVILRRQATLAQEIVQHSHMLLSKPQQMTQRLFQSRRLIKTLRKRTRRCFSCPHVCGCDVDVLSRLVMWLAEIPLTLNRSLIRAKRPPKPMVNPWCSLKQPGAHVPCLPTDALQGSRVWWS